MTRRTRANSGKESTPPAGPVRVRSMNRPRAGWTEAEALDLLRQGYAPAQVARVTGYGVDWLTAQPVPRKPIHPALASTRRDA